jgi:hypothetical protein
MKFCVYTRSFYENPYLDAFIEHYCRLGFDKIVILKVDGSLNSCPREFANKVEFYSVPNEANGLLPKYDKLVLKNNYYDWILSVDVDEFLLLNKKYKNIQDYVDQFLKKHPQVNGFYFRWGMIEKYNIETDHVTLETIVQKYKVYKNMHIKSMIKRENAQKIHDPHVCKFKNNNIQIYFENQVINKSSPLHEITANSYCDSILVHVHTRSLHNIVVKALNTGLTNKIVANLSGFSNLIKQTNAQTPDQLLKLFKECIGKKATLPFAHSKPEVIEWNWFLSNISFSNSAKIIDLKEETKDLVKSLESKKINRLEYLGFLNKLNEATKLLFIR